MTVTYRNERGVAFGVSGEPEHNHKWHRSYNKYYDEAKDYAWDIAGELDATDELGSLIAIWSDVLLADADERRRMITEKLEKMVDDFARKMADEVTK